MSGPKCDAIELRRQEKQRRREEYQKRLKEEQARKRAEAERRVRLAEERARQEEEKRQAEERKRLEEEKRQAEERKRREEEKRQAEERKRQEEERRQAEERKRQEEERRLTEEFNVTAEEEYQALLRFQERREQERREREQWELRRRELEQRELEQGKRSRQQYSQLQQRFEEALSLYEAASSLAGEEPAYFAFDSETAEAQIDRMNRLTENLQERTVEKECRAQVSALIDSVITDMGYEIMAEKGSKTSEGATARLYRYEEDTAISVIDVNGQFTMEVVALDGQNRPAGPEEAERLYESMGKFCEDYEEIKQKLEETGQVVSRNIFHLPPDRRLARVINREEYEKRGGTKRRKYDESYMEEQGARAEIRRTGN